MTAPGLVGDDPTRLDPARLHDIIEPAAVPFVPHTVGWALAAVTLVGVLGAIGWLWHRRRTRERYRRAALAELDRLVARAPASPEERAALVGDTAAILKRVALVSFGREAAAALSGEPWLAFLDARWERDDFRSGSGRLLADAAYRPPADLEAADVSALVATARAWVSTHRREGR